VDFSASFPNPDFFKVWTLWLLGILSPVCFTVSLSCRSHSWYPLLLGTNEVSLYISASIPYVDYFSLSIQTEAKSLKDHNCRQLPQQYSWEMSTVYESGLRLCDYTSHDHTSHNTNPTHTRNDKTSVIKILSWKIITKLFNLQYYVQNVITAKCD
jgi:hypothetical protein